MMGPVLCVETATPVCSVAIAQDGELLALKENKEGNRHASHLTLLAEEALKEAGYQWKDVSAVAVSKGPGSYTGLRVGVSAAKGFCYALNIPLIATDTLKSLALAGRQALPAADGPFFLVPMIDARRMEVYCSVFDQNLQEIEGASALIIDGGSFSSYKQRGMVYFFGTGAAKCEPLIGEEQGVFIRNIDSSAAFMASSACEKLEKGLFEDTAYFEPFYLKDFVGTVSRKK